MSGTSSRAARWKIADAVEHYGIHGWGRGFVDVNEKGNLVIAPAASPGRSVDLEELVEGLAERGVGLPLLIRFPDLLRARIDEINAAFATAKEEFGYRGRYRGVYPIKVNQDRFLVEDLVRFGRPYHHGLEAGSKPELLAVMAMLEDEDALVVCNGYKDEEYVDTALLASRLGPEVVLVAEKPHELELIVERGKALGIEPRIGIRARLSARGAGHWEGSGGDRSKFGFGARDLLEAVEFLRAREELDSLVLLHFHLGSQISSIRNVKDAVREGAWTYANLVGLGATLGYLDVGGGLGVDYDGSQTNFASSMNYTLQEYANDVVFGIQEVCDPAGVPHPTIVTESGRATVAHHAVLVLEVLGVGEFRVGELPEEVSEETPAPVANLVETCRDLSPKNARESYHDALGYRDECLSLYSLGHLSLPHRVLAEDAFWTLCRRLRRMIREMSRVPEELAGLDHALADTYFCNFSVFQSMPDAWAIDQLFPLVPIHRLDREPTRQGILADITCDSDGKIDRFIDPRQVRTTLDLHELGDEPYYLAAFLVGAYQEILGDLHNLFGDTNTVHVTLLEDGDYEIDEVVEGDTVQQVLRYVGYKSDDLVARVRKRTERAIRRSLLSREQAKELLRAYQQGLAGYTYLERD